MQINWLGGKRTGFYRQAHATPTSQPLQPLQPQGGDLHGGSTCGPCHPRGSAGAHYPAPNTTPCHGDTAHDQDPSLSRHRHLSGNTATAGTQAAARCQRPPDTQTATRRAAVAPGADALGRQTVLAINSNSSGKRNQKPVLERHLLENRKGLQLPTCGIARQNSFYLN